MAKMKEYYMDKLDLINETLSEDEVRKLMDEVTMENDREEIRKIRKVEIKAFLRGLVTGFLLPILLLCLLSLVSKLKAEEISLSEIKEFENNIREVIDESPINYLYIYNKKVDYKLVDVVPCKGGRAVGCALLDNYKIILQKNNWSIRSKESREVLFAHEYIHMYFEILHTPKGLMSEMYEDSLRDCRHRLKECIRETLNNNPNISKYNSSKREIIKICLNEARGEPLEGKKEVIKVILNRVRDNTRRWPSSVTKVVNQDKQFSNRLSLASFLDLEAKKDCEYALEAVLRLKVLGKFNYFYANKGKNKINPPNWAKNIKSSKQVGNHLFLEI